MSVVKVGDVVALGNDVLVQVIKVLDYNNETYIYAMVSPSDLKDALDVANVEYVFLKEVVDKDNEELYLNKVVDEVILSKLSAMV